MKGVIFTGAGVEVVVLGGREVPDEERRDLCILEREVFVEVVAQLGRESRPCVGVDRVERGGQVGEQPVEL